MTEVPEHLLRRSRERKAALSGEESPAGDAGGAGAAGGGGEGGGAGGAGGALEPAAAAAPARAAAPQPPTYTGPPQPPPRKQRVPMWAMPVLVAMPFWALLYSGSFGDRPSLHAEETPLEAGAGVYRSAGCSTCHGAAGEGVSAPGLGDVVKQFPAFEDHVAWVANGSAAVKGQPYGALGRVASGGMPGFASQLSEAEILAVVCHERVTYGKEAVPAQCEAEAGTEGIEAEGGGEAGDQTGGGSAEDSGGGGDLDDTDTDTDTTAETEGGTENPNAPTDTAGDDH